MQMANLPQSLSMNAAAFGGPATPAASPSGAGNQGNKERKMMSAEQLVLELSSPELRENALLELSKKREIFQDLAPLLWNSFGTIAALLQEIVSIYPVLSPPNLTPAQSNRVCNALALLQCVASHPETRTLFLKAHMPLYLYPFLNTTSKTRPFEYLRLTSLGVIGALVKVDDTEVISFLLSTEIIPLCLRTMEMGSELSKTVATFIVQKILLDEVGLDYICTTAERFFAVGRVLANMVSALAEQPSSRLLKHIIRCYLRLSDNSRACDALRSCLPETLSDATFINCLREDPTTKRWLQQLLINVQGPRLGQPGRPSLKPAFLHTFIYLKKEDNTRLLPNPEVVFESIIGLIVRLAEHGLIHCDYNEFNIMIDDDEKITMIDFPQMVSVKHYNAEIMATPFISLRAENMNLQRTKAFDSNNLKEGDTFLKKGRIKN